MGSDRLAGDVNEHGLIKSGRGGACCCGVVGVLFAVEGGRLRGVAPVCWLGLSKVEGLRN
jgi:hypothetical protein